MRDEEMETLVIEHLTDDFLTGSIRAVFDARQLAHALCVSDFEPPEAKNLQPLIVRGKINEYLRGIAERIPNCTATVEHSKGSPMQRTELRSGPLSLTAHAVQSPCGEVKRYQYRQSLASGNQPTLFDYDFPVGDTLYVLLLHGPYRARTVTEQVTYAYLPGSIYLAFPTSGLNCYVHSVNLVSRFPSLVESLLPKEWDDKAKIFYRWQAAAREIS